MNHATTQPVPSAYALVVESARHPVPKGCIYRYLHHGNAPLRRGYVSRSSVRTSQVKPQPQTTVTLYSPEADQHSHRFIPVTMDRQRVPIFIRNAKREGYQIHSVRHAPATKEIDFWIEGYDF